MKVSWSGHHSISKRVTGSIRSLTIILLALMVAVNALPVLAAGSQSPLAGSVSGLDNLSYAVLQGWTFLDSNVVVTSATNDWTNGYIDIAMTSNGSASDQLRVLSSGLLNITGDAVSWNGTRIGTIELGAQRRERPAAADQLQCQPVELRLRDRQLLRLDGK